VKHLAVLGASFGVEKLFVAGSQDLFAGAVEHAAISVVHAQVFSAQADLAITILDVIQDGLVALFACLEGSFELSNAIYGGLGRVHA